MRKTGHMCARRALQAVAVVPLGVFTGAMFLIAVGVGPYWKSLPLAEYRVAFQALGPFLGKVMVPLMVASIVLPGLCAFLDKPARKRWALAAGLVFLIVPLYGLVHGPVNDLLLASNPLGDEFLAQLRCRWMGWHWARTALGMAGLVTALAALSCRSET